MKEKPVVGIATDGAHSAKERLTRFRAVDLSSGKELFSKAIGNWTNNIGEFLGIVEAVRYVMEHPESPRTIYSDSITAITWYCNKQTASSRRCPALQKAEIFLKVMEARIKDIEVLHWAILGNSFDTLTKELKTAVAAFEEESAAHRVVDLAADVGDIDDDIVV
jgi:ribonuclease HI